MMPPKKSKAARAEEPTENGTEKAAPASTDSESEEQVQHKNIFKTEIVEGKRERHMPPAEQKLTDWISENFEDREETKISVNQAYTEYLDNCANTGKPAVEDFKFRRTLKEHFPKGFGLKEGSVYKDVLKEKKIPVKSKKPVVQAESLQLKMKDVIITAIKELGNPKGGVRFHAIMKFISGRWPALQIEQKSNRLISAIQMELRYGHIVCLRGIGKCGFYRIPVPGEEEEEEEMKKEAKEAAKSEEAEDGEDKEDEAGEEGKENDEGKDGEEKDEEMKDEPRTARGAKRKAQQNISGASKAKKGKGKGKGKKAVKKTYRKFVVHSDPQRVDDCFSLAMTFSTEPKEASVGKIRKYVAQYYDVHNLESRLKTCLENGCEKGYWEQITGSSGTQGTFRLSLEAFDPTDDDDLYGMVINAIMASVEPKQCSALTLKKYIMDYHPHLKVADRPYLFKKALQRSVDKGFLRQLSGIGATGTFQMSESFVPSPTILRGEDSESTYDSEEEEESSDEETEVEEYAVDVESFMDRYKPRPTKRRGHGRAAGIDSYGQSVSKIAKPAPPPPKRKAPAVRRELPAPKSRSKAKPAAKSAAKPAAKPVMPVPTKASRKAPPPQAAKSKAKKGRSRK